MSTSTNCDRCGVLIKGPGFIGVLHVISNDNGMFSMDLCRACFNELQRFADGYSIPESLRERPSTRRLNFSYASSQER